MLENCWHGFVHVLQGLGSVAHILQDLCVCVWVLQSFPLELNGGQCPINLGQLLLKALLPLQGHEGNWLREDAQSIHHDRAGYCQATHTSSSIVFIFGLWQVIQQVLQHLYDVTDWTFVVLPKKQINTVFYLKKCSLQLWINVKMIMITSAQ